MHYLIILVQYILLSNLLQHLLVTLKCLYRYVLFRITIYQVYRYLHLCLTTIPHQNILNRTKTVVFRKVKLRLNLMRLYVTLDKVNTSCVHRRLQHLPQLLLIQQLKSLVIHVLNYRHLLTDTLLHHVKHIILQPTINMEEKILSLFHLTSLLVGAMNITGNHSIKMPNMIIFLLVYHRSIIRFLLICLHKKVCYVLLWYLMVFLHAYVFIFRLKHELAFPLLKKT